MLLTVLTNCSIYRTNQRSARLVLRFETEQVQSQQARPRLLSTNIRDRDEENVYFRDRDQENGRDRESR